MFGGRTYYNRTSQLENLKKGIEDVVADLKPTEAMFNALLSSYYSLRKYKDTTFVYKHVVSFIETTELTLRWNETKKSKYNYTVIDKCSSEKLETLIKLGKNGSLKESLIQNKDTVAVLISNIDKAIEYYKILSLAAVNE
uniref:Uncharacterized protein n=1 Tax=viral metagenome TaxID=1070528 RepID=A0A6C0JS20_9ZZZZ